MGQLYPKLGAKAFTPYSQNPIYRFPKNFGQWSNKGSKLYRKHSFCPQTGQVNKGDNSEYFGKTLFAYQMGYFYSKLGPKLYTSCSWNAL